MMLSKNFSLNELTKSQTALRLDINNNPNADAIAALIELSVNILEPVRTRFDIPYTPSSGYRSEELCVAIGSKTTSQHALGEAADFEVPTISNFTVAMWIKDNLVFDQLILEHYTGGNSGWIHCSYTEKKKNRKEYLTYDKVNGYIKMT
tara:strand:+ start:2870 stop:3316 length:447 start_codon:yes stop_codon:yes gene_type:complete